MKIALIILIVALIAKDTSYLGDPYIMRGFAQALCLFFGVLWIVNGFSTDSIKKYWPILGYLLIVFISVVVSTDPIYVFLQSVSLFSVIIFFIAYYESNLNSNSYGNHSLLNTSIILYSIVALISLILIFVNKSIAYEILYGGEVRFRGLFSKAGMMGAASGLLMGMALFKLKSLSIKLLCISIAILCLSFTLSRTFWIATLLAILFTTWVYYPFRRRYVFLGLTMVVFIAGSFSAFNVTVNTKEASKVIRSGSLSSLSGRIGMWERGWEEFMNKPVIGNGFTVGSAALAGDKNSTKNSNYDSRNISRTTLHSGYIQSLLDTGALGTMFYIMILTVSIWRIYRNDIHRLYPTEFFILIFLIIANSSENIIYAASVYHSIIFWAIAIFSMSLPRAPSYHRRNDMSFGVAHVK